MNTPDAPYSPAKPGQLGLPVTGAKLRLVDDNNDELDKKKPQLGQALVMGTQLMAKYLNLPEEQKYTVRGTWLHTGDVVETDKDGRVLIHDRKADMIALAGGRKIKPREVEPLICEHPLIEECAYINTLDRMNKPIIAVVLVRKAQAKLTETEVREYLKTRLAMQKMPSAIFFTDAMPRTPNGVINRGKLRSQYEGA